MSRHRRRTRALRPLVVKMAPRLPLATARALGQQAIRQRGGEVLRRMDYDWHTGKAWLRYSTASEEAS